MTSDELLTLFGSRLKEARQQKGMTQSDLAEATGLPQQYISLIETGRQNVTLETVVALAAVVDCEIGAMLRPPVIHRMPQVASRVRTTRDHSGKEREAAAPLPVQPVPPRQAP